MNMPINKIVDSFFNSSISDILGTDFTINQPSANIIENENDFHIDLAAPGFKKSDFDIEVLNDKLTISINNEQSEKKEEVPFTKREYSYGNFKRSFHLPESIDAESIAASYKHGMLQIVLNKKEEALLKSKTIKIS